jgi:hypothetical protein
MNLHVYASCIGPSYQPQFLNSCYHLKFVSVLSAFSDTIHSPRQTKKKEQQSPVSCPVLHCIPSVYTYSFANGVLLRDGNMMLILRASSRPCSRMAAPVPPPFLWNEMKFREQAVWLEQCCNNPQHKGCFSRALNRPAGPPRRSNPCAASCKPAEHASKYRR